MKRTRLYDRQWSLLWDSSTDTTPAYRHIATWVRATIEHDDGTRWVGEFYRCPEGIRRDTYPDPAEVERLLTWPTFGGVA
jgi:hypothetical protein